MQTDAALSGPEEVFERELVPSHRAVGALALGVGIEGLERRGVRQQIVVGLPRRHG